MKNKTHRKNWFCCIFLLLAGWNLYFFSYETKSRAATLPPGFLETTVVSGLTASVGVEFLPDGRMLVIEQSGKVQLVVNDVLQSTPILDISNEVLFEGDQGLLGIAIDPDYPSRPYI